VSVLTAETKGNCNVEQLLWAFYGVSWFRVST